MTAQTPPASPDSGGGSAERIVIRDKRKISPAGSAQAAPPDGNGANMATPEDPATAAERATDETTTTPAEPAEAAADSQVSTATDASAAGDTTAAEAGESAITEDTIEIPTESTAQATAVEGEIVADQPEAAPAEATEAPAEEDDSGPLGAELEMLRKQLDEAQIDIKRVAAEYKNYRDRVKRDQAAAAELAVASVLSALLPVLDDLDRARDHGDLTGPFGSVAEQLLATVGKLGLTAFGAKGDQFDPKLHEAVAHVPTADAAEETCVDVMRRGYMLGERLLRPAMVAVAAPQE